MRSYAALPARPRVQATRGLWAALAWLFLAPVQAAERYPFDFESARVGDGSRLAVHNRGPAPVSVRLELEAADAGVACVPGCPVVAVVAPYSELELTRVQAADPDRGYRFRSRIVAMPGDVAAVPDAAALYRLPYADGLAFAMVQAPGGPIATHTTPESFHAIDFAMPEGSPVVAARDGTVIAMASAFSDGGRDAALIERANFVDILHGDGTIATYAHLAPGAPWVAPGQRVRAGSQIGRSGSTGYSFGPHLHFGVRRLVETVDGFAAVSVPVTFYVGDPPQAFRPRYLMEVTADYAPAAGPPPLVRMPAPTPAAIGRSRASPPS